MNITFTPQPIPELTIDGGMLAALGFTPGTPLQLTLRADGLWITPSPMWPPGEHTVRSQPTAARFGAGLGTAERRADHQRGVAHRVRDH